MSLIPLRAGPLTLAFDRENGSIRYIFAGPHEVLRGVAALVRDAQWQTIRPAVMDLQLESDANCFRVAFNVRCRSDAVDFRWGGSITGEAMGTITFDFEGEALRQFARNRIGFCVLHPAEAAGCALVVERTNGGREVAQLPKGIAPHQPFFDLRALTHEFAPGLRAEVRLEGDTFEMEDQRNWTDASFKTYSTPLALPRPVTLPAGTRIRQRATVRLLDAVPPANTPPAWLSPPEVRLDIGLKAAAALPTLGTQWSGKPVPGLIAALRPLRLHHLRIDLSLAEGMWREPLHEGAAASTLLDVALELAVFVDDNVTAQFTELCETLGTLTPAPRIARWLVFHVDHPSTPPGCITAWREVFAATPFAAPVGGGATNNFTELNRGREIAGVADFTVHACNPQVHAFDDRSLIETLAIQAATVSAARKFSNGKPAVVSPVTLTPRLRSVEPGRAAQTPSAIRPFQFDERLTTPFAAAWTLASVAALANASAASVTYFEAAGANGLIAPDDSLRPIHHLFAALAPISRARVGSVTCSHPLSIAALALETSDRRVLFAAGFGASPQEVRLTGAWGERTLIIGPHLQQIDLARL